MKVKIQDKLYQDIVDYCAINKLDVEKFINNVLKMRFMVEKYGERPNINPTKKVSEIINEPKKEPINEPIKETKPEKEEKPKKEEKHKTKPIQVVEFRPVDIVWNDEPTEPVKEKHRKLTKK